MKLKLVVASMSVLGLISCPVFADDSTNTPTPKHKHHKMKHRMVVHHQSYKGDFKGEMAPVVEACPINNWYTPMMTSMTQNTGRAVPTVNCFNPITFAGGIATDLHTFNLSKGYAGENNDRISLNDAYLNIFGNVNQYVKAFASISYNNASRSTHEATLLNGSSSGFRSYNLPGAYKSATTPNRLDLEQAFVTFSDLDNTPVFFQIGKQYADYNRYDIHPIERTMTQVLTETLRTSAELGFVTRAGFHGTVTAFDDQDAKASVGHSTYVYGASLGFDQVSDTLGWDVGAGYMSSMTGANDIATAEDFSVNHGGTFVHRVGAVAVYGHVNSGPFTFGANYASALSRFNGADIAKNSAGAGAKPRALDLKAGYGFNAWCKNQNVYVGYQKSWDSAQIPLPNSRWLLGYGVDVLPNTMLGAEFGHDIAYGGTHFANAVSTGNSNTLGLRAAVKFG